MSSYGGIVVTRHGLVGDDLCLSEQGQLYADTLPDLLRAINPDILKYMARASADGVAGASGCQRCVNTLQPLADRSDYAINQFATGSGLAEFLDMVSNVSWGVQNGVHVWCAICVRREDDYSAIQKQVGLPGAPHDSVWDYENFIDYYYDGSWKVNVHSTGQSSPSLEELLAHGDHLT